LNARKDESPKAFGMISIRCARPHWCPSRRRG
jgi:hypothetical protein